MPVDIIEIESKFYNEITNGESFNQNLSNFDLCLTGSVMGRYKVVKKINISWYFQPTNYNTIKYTHLGGYKYELERLSGDFLQDGFSIGDNVFWDNDVINPSMNPNNNGTVYAINKTKIYIQFVFSNGTSGEVDYGTLLGTTPIQSLVYRFGLVENAQAFNPYNYVTNEEQGYYIDGITSSFATMNKLGAYKGWVSGDMRIKKNTNPSTFVQEFEIEHTFIIPYYKDGELDNLQNNILPDVFANSNTLKYAYKYEFRNVLNNPNTSKILVSDTIKGSVGWFNESYNGFNTGYSIKSVTGDLYSGEESEITILVSGDFSTYKPNGVYLSYLPALSQYSNMTAEDFTTNVFLYDRVISRSIGTTLSGGIIKEVVTSMQGADLKIVFKTEYTTDQQKIIRDTRNYIIGVEVDGVMLLADVNTYITNADIDGLLELDSLLLFQNNKEYDTLIDGYTDIKAIIEDNIYIKSLFSIDLSKQAYINSIDVQLLAYKDSSNYFVLDTYFVPCNYTLVSGGIQQLEGNKNTNNGFIRTWGSEFSFASIETKNRVLDNQYYEIICPVKITWQDWIKENDADTIFYDKSKLNNGLNKKASNYTTNGYSIRIGIKVNMSGIDVLGNSGFTDYMILTPILDVKDYQQNSDISCEFTTYDQDTLVDLKGLVLTNKNTIVKSVWSKVGGFSDVNDYWGEHRIQEQNQIGNVLKVSNSEVLVSDTLFKFGLLDKQLVSGNIECTSIIDYTKLQNGINYSLSARLEGLTSDVPPNAKMTEEDEYKITEDGEYKIME